MLSPKSFDELLVLRDLAVMSDRAVAIVGGAIIEDRLTTALKASLHSDKKIDEAMFQPMGPLGTFHPRYTWAS